MCEWVGGWVVGEVGGKVGGKVGWEQFFGKVEKLGGWMGAWVGGCVDGLGGQVVGGWATPPGILSHPHPASAMDNEKCHPTHTSHQP